MAARESVGILTQLGREDAPGTAVPATHTLSSLNLAFGPKLGTRQARSAGNRFQTTGVRNKQWAQGRYDGIGSYNELALILAGLIGSDYPTQIGATAGHTWTFEPKAKGSAKDDPALFTGRRGDADAAMVAAYLQFLGISLNWTRDEVNVSGDVLARAVNNSGSLTTLADEIQLLKITGAPTGGTFTLTFGAQTTSAIPYNATAAQVQTALDALSSITAGKVACSGGPLPSKPVRIHFISTLGGANQAAITTNSAGLTGGSTPTAAITTLNQGGAEPVQIAEAPISGGEVSVYVDSTAGGLGGTKLTDAYSASFDLSGKYTPKWVLDASLPSFKEFAGLPVTPQLVVEAENNAQTRALFDAVNANNLPFRYTRVEAVGPNIGSGADYKFTSDFACKLNDAEEVEDREGTYGFRFVWDVMFDPAWGKAFQMVLVNTLSWI
jgi:hypothetical protein